jgi:Family of unknown function (DUF5895)
MNQSPTISTPSKQDRFASPEYNKLDARLPRITAMRGETGADQCGYFIPANELALAGWHDLDDSQLVEYQYNSGKTEQGILLKSPRMLVVPRSPLFAIDDAATRNSNRMVIAGEYDKSKYADRTKFTTARAFEVLLLSPDNQPLHETPFGYIPKGYNQLTFSTHWEELVREVTQCHAIGNGISARPKDIRFSSLCVFQFTVKRGLVGTTAKSPACQVESHLSPTQANWESFFLGRQDTLADRFLNILAPNSQLTLPTLPATDDPDPTLAEQIDSNENISDPDAIVVEPIQAPPTSDSDDDNIPF